MSRQIASAAPLAAISLLALLLALVAGPAASAAVLPVDSTVVLSGAPDLLSLLPAPASSAEIADGQAIDGAGGKIVFTSSSDGLAADDDDDVANVYVKDVLSGAVTLVSRDASGAPSHAGCRDAAISDDGNHVAFVCAGPLVPEDTNGKADVYMRDLGPSPATKLVSRATDGALGNADSGRPAISADGSFVAFESSASTFGPTGILRVYRRDVVNGRTILVGQPSGTANTPPPEPSSRPSISNDGNRIAFQTDAPLDLARDLNRVQDVYLRDVNAALTIPVSTRDLGLDPPTGDGPSGSAFISGDGKTVFFVSSADDLDVADGDSVPNLFEKRFVTGGELTAVVSGPDARKLDNAAPHGVNDSGCAVFTAGGDAYVGTGSTAATLVSSASFTAGAPSFGGVSRAAIPGFGCGLEVAMGVDHGVTSDVLPDFASVVVRDAIRARFDTVSRPAGTDPFVNQGGDARDVSVSADGRYAAFASTASGLGIPPGQAGVFRRDVATGDVVPVSIGTGGQLLTLGAVAVSNLEPRISGDGSRVAFLLPDPLDGSRHVLVRDVAGGRTVVADVVKGTTATFGDQPASGVTISDDGSRVAFETAAKLDPGADTDANRDVYVRDLGASQTILVDRAEGATGTKSSDASHPAISGDGHRVAFETFGSLSGGDPNDSSDDVYVRDLDAFHTTLASVTGSRAAGNEVKGDGDSLLPSISRDGSRVAFVSFATNFDPSGSVGLYVRDIAKGTLTIASRADGPAGASTSVLLPIHPLLSADGQHVAFAAQSNGIAPGDPADGTPRVFERDLGPDLTGATTRLISRRSGADGAASDVASGLIGLTADGGCVAFAGTGHVLTPPASADHLAVFMRAVIANCGRPIPPPPPGTQPPGGQAKPAVLSRLAVKPARFFVVVARGGGTRIVFRLDKASAVTLAFDRLLPGHRKGRRCLTTVRRGRRCTVVRRVGRVALAQRRLRAGANSTKFTGKIGRRALAPGSYRLTATPLHGKARSVRFTVVRAPNPKRRSR